MKYHITSDMISEQIKFNYKNPYSNVEKIVEDHG